MGVISVEQANELYWLGRYTERVYTTVRMYFKTFDTMIDDKEDAYIKFCSAVDIPNVYADRADFQTNYAFNKENPDSIISNLERAYDNAIVLRDSISTEALSYVQLAIYEMNKAAASDAPLFELQHVLDVLLAFWGIVDDRIDSEQIRNIIKAGKRIERIDIYARLGAKPQELRREVHRMLPRVTRSGLPYSENALINVRDMVEEEKIDYYQIVSNVENIF